MDRITQIGTLEFAFEVSGFVTHDQFVVARDAELDAHHGQNCAGGVFCALFDANPAGNQPAVDILQFGNARANKVLRPFRAFDIVEGDLQGHLHGSLPAIKQAFWLRSRPFRSVRGRRDGHPMMRQPPLLCCAAAMALLCVLVCARPGATDAPFAAWLQSLWPQAQALGISRATFEAATRGLEPDLSGPDLVLPGRPERPTAGQPEFVTTPADYLKEPAIERLAGEARKIYDRYRAPLDSIERQFGVPATVVLAIFGRETDFGRAADARNAIRVLATQAYLGRRKEQFLTEFLLALKIVDQGQIKLADMKSSCAGAM